MNNLLVLRKITASFFSSLTLILLSVSCAKFKTEKIYDSKVNNNIQTFAISGSVNGFHYIPDEIKHKGLVITFGGSEGSAGEYYAADIANKGYEVLAVYYFGKENQPVSISEVPLEFFSEVLNYAEKKCKSIEPITLLGGSKGAELAAILSSYYSRIDNVILFAPSSFVFQGLDYSSQKSSWSWKKTPLPFITFSQKAYEKMRYENNAIVLRDMYEAAVELTPPEILKKASINLSNLKGNALIFTGGDDALWQSDSMAQILKKQNPEKTELHIFEKAGHAFGAAPVSGGIKLGGTPEANKTAAVESSRILIEFLNKQHK